MITLDREILERSSRVIEVEAPVGESGVPVGRHFLHLSPWCFLADERPFNNVVSAAVAPCACCGAVARGSEGRRRREAHACQLWAFAFWRLPRKWSNLPVLENRGCE
jgi:hypothetical protein